MGSPGKARRKGWAPSLWPRKTASLWRKEEGLVRLPWEAHKRASQSLKTGGKTKG